MRGYFAAFREGEPKDVVYELVEDARVTVLVDVQWADWDAEGRLLAATRDGRVQIRALSSEEPRVLSEANVGELAPSPTPAPPDAERW